MANGIERTNPAGFGSKNNKSMPWDGFRHAFVQKFYKVLNNLEVVSLKLVGLMFT